MREDLGEYYYHDYMNMLKGKRRWWWWSSPVKNNTSGLLPELDEKEDWMRRKGNRKIFLMRYSISLIEIPEDAMILSKIGLTIWR